MGKRRAPLGRCCSDVYTWLRPKGEGGSARCNPQHSPHPPEERARYCSNARTAVYHAKAPSHGQDIECVSQ